MSEKTDKLTALYERLAQSEEGQHLMNWVEKSAQQIRKDASKSKPIEAYGELRFADGMDYVLEAIKTNRRANQMGKR